LDPVVLNIEITPIEEDGYHIFVPARINGKRARFLVDTGASRSVVDKDRIAAFFQDEELKLEKIEKLSTGLGTNTMESNTLLLKNLSFGKRRFRNYRAVALDLSHVNESYSLLKMKKIDGVLGGDILISMRAIIDYKDQILVINS